VKVKTTDGNVAAATHTIRLLSFLAPVTLPSGVARIWCQEGHMQKLLDFYRKQLSTYGRCQILYKSKCTEKFNCCVSRGARTPVPQCPIASDANGGWPAERRRRQIKRTGSRFSPMHTGNSMKRINAACKVVIQ